MTCPIALPCARSDAYQQFYTSNGKSADAKEAVAVATMKLNSICPGAAS